MSSVPSKPKPSATRARDSFVLSQRVSDVVVASLRLLQTPLFVEASSPRVSLAHFAGSPGRRRLARAAQTSVTFEMLGLCCSPHVMSSSSGILSFVELRTVRVPLEISSQQLLICELSP